LLNATRTHRLDRRRLNGREHKRASFSERIHSDSKASRQNCELACGRVAVGPAERVTVIAVILVALRLAGVG